MLSEGSRQCELGAGEGSVNVDWKRRPKGDVGLRGGGAQKVRTLGGERGHGEQSSLSVMQLIAMLAKDMPERSRKTQ